ncbi:cytochrome P450 [Rhodococcus sp. AG1013]|uniref:cytochrome P450 family protein n=1 Tax=Rhodococcus sp. AG1013 TaxID=2183996 RepID=UPI000E0CA6FA|nr:cytochrome P450 [Rhodococcus sp. AG1013]RDI17663.1 cytochrome P450 [Rhodococcus sp. AG1013]
MTTIDVVDLREHSADFLVDPYPFLHELRAGGPVHRVILPEFGETWVVVGYAAAKAALSHPGLTKDWRTATPRWRTWFAGDADAESPSFGKHMLMTDPPDHTRLRKLVAKAFTPQRIAALTSRIEEITDSLLDDFPADGHVDLVDALAFPLPISVICEVFGVDSLDRDKFREWTNKVVNPVGEDISTAARELGDYLNDLVESKRNRPTDDLFGALIGATDDAGGGLSASELRAMAFLLLGAGHETTLTLIANGVFALLSHPDQLAALRADYTLIDNAVEEILRYEGPIKNATWRFAGDPVEIAGVTIPGGGTEVLVALASGSHDPSRYPEPDNFDIRRDAGGHLAFGHGIHFCQGAALARLEGRIALRKLFERFPDIALDILPEKLAWRPGYLMRGFDRLPIRF